MTRLSWITSLAVTSTLMAGCSGPAPEGTDTCVPGQTIDCACFGTERGVQTCTDEGTFASCQCLDPQDAGDTMASSDTDASSDADAADTDGVDAADVVDTVDEDPSGPDSTEEGDTTREDTNPDTSAEDTTPEDVGADVPGDVAPSDTGIDDTGPEDGGSADTLVDVAPDEYTVVLQVVDPEDALSSYLMDPELGAWNIFAGETVYWGRRSAAPHVSYQTAFRFVDVAIPAGAEVLEATLAIYPHNAVDASHKLALNVYAERVADSAPYDSGDYTSGRPDQRLRTSASVEGWVVRCVDPCREAVEFDCAQRVADCWTPETPYVIPKDLTDLVQEVIALDGWAAGNALSLFVVNMAGDSDYDLSRYNDSRALVGFDADAPAHAPTLTVRYRVE